MQMIFKPSDDMFDTVTVDLDKVVTMDLSEYGLDIYMHDGRVITIDALQCTNYDIVIKHGKKEVTP